MSYPVNALVVGSTARLVTCCNCHLSFPQDRVIFFHHGNGFPDRYLCVFDAQEVANSWKGQGCASCDAAAERFEVAIAAAKNAEDLHLPETKELEHKADCRWKQ